jgi:hypothetical protein
MLLGAAKYLAATRKFSGTVVLIFQPAEEGGSGGKFMLEDGLLSRFPIEEIFGLHNIPGIPVGSFAIRSGPTMAAADQFTIDVMGKGGHAATPHSCVDPIVVGSHIVVALQTLVARNVDPLQPAVLSVTSLTGGEAFNIIADRARLIGARLEGDTTDEGSRGSCRCLRREGFGLLPARLPRDFQPREAGFLGPERRGLRETGRSSGRWERHACNDRGRLLFHA